MMKFFTGIGSRGIGKTRFERMRLLSQYCVFTLGMRLRSGHADGADWACELGSEGVADIYTPFKGFGTRDYKDSPGNPILGVEIPCSDKFSKKHPSIEHRHIFQIFQEIRGGNFNTLKPIMKKLLLRNMSQIMGHKGVLTTLVLACYDDTVTSGTEYAVCLADHLDIPVINTYHKKSLQSYKNLIKAIYLDCE